MEPIFYAHCSTPACITSHTSDLCLYSFQTLDPGPLSALTPLSTSFHPYLYPSILPCMLCFTLSVVSPLFFPLCPSLLLSLTDIMSSHYLHSSYLPQSSISPLSVCSPPPRLSPPDRVTYYLHHSPHPSFLSHKLTLALSMIRHTFTHLIYPLSVHLNSQQCNTNVAHFKKAGNLCPLKQDTNLSPR